MKINLLPQAKDDKRTVARLSNLGERPWTVRSFDLPIESPKLVNLSPGGMTLDFGHEPKVSLGHRVALKLDLHEKQPYDLEGRIVWRGGQKVGLALDRVPAALDAFIMREIHKDAVENRSAYMTLVYERELEQRLGYTKKKSIFDNMAAIFASIFSCLLIITILHLYNSKFPERTLKAQITNAFNQRSN